MNKKIVIGAVLVIIIVSLATIIFSNRHKVKSNQEFTSKVVNPAFDNSKVKEFSMTSFTDIVNGQYHPSFSVKNITVNKGDSVRIKITEISGNHDFKIDEFGVYTVTDLNKEATVEFVADKAGEFIYYCTKPGHRQNGQWGTLKVI